MAESEHYSALLSNDPDGSKREALLSTSPDVFIECMARSSKYLLSFRNAPLLGMHLEDLQR